MHLQITLFSTTTLKENSKYFLSIFTLLKKSGKIGKQKTNIKTKYKM